MGHCSFASSSLILCSIPGEVQGRRKETTQEIKTVRDITSQPLVIPGFQPSCVRNVLYYLRQAVAPVGTSHPYLI